MAAFAEEQRCRPTQQTHPERRSSTKRSPNKGVISLTLLEPAGLASGWAGVMAIKLQTQSVMATAPQELCFEVVAAAGRKVEEISPTERVVEFKTTYRGREVVTLERLHQEPPALIDYEWVKGPLPQVRESIAFTTEGENRPRITYNGVFDVTGGPLARIAARLWIKPTFERIVLEHLEDAKRIAERRACRSHIYRQDNNDTDNNRSRAGGTI